jgi:hypothetical protein
VSEIYGPFDGATWAQAQWYRYAPTWGPSGVIDSPTASASAGGLGLSFSGLTPTLAIGRAWVRGAGYEISGTAKTMTAVPANANATLSRRDRIVLRRDLAAGTVTLVLIQGTPLASPTPPALTQVETGQWDMPLFSFLVPPASGSTITGIVDERLFIDPATGDLMVYTMANRPTVGLVAGMKIRAADDVARVYTYDGTYWRNGSADNLVPPGAAAGNYITGVHGFTSTTANSSGVVTVTHGRTFSAAPATVEATSAGGEVSNGTQVYPISNTITTTAFNVGFRDFGGTALGAVAVKFNWRVVGYNT